MPIEKDDDEGESKEAKEEKAAVGPPAGMTGCGPSPDMRARLIPSCSFGQLPETLGKRADRL